VSSADAALFFDPSPLYKIGSDEEQITYDEYLGDYKGKNPVVILFPYITAGTLAS
jgi:hypothetical protein|tara:strand:+ start:45 stop:209 length:165 start_codon:yes stop_codon:yes gene_type:complete